jgi:hypothetical protein
VFKEALTGRETRSVVLVPGAVAALTFLLALWQAPSIDDHNHGEFSTLYGTAGQIIATLLVALALEARALPLEFGNARRLVAGFTLTYVGVGLVASVVALNGSLPSCAYEPLFALAMGGGAGALLSVLMIAYRIVDAEFDARRRRIRRPGSRDEDDTAPT